MRLAILFLIFPLLATAQLKEFEVSEMERPDVAVVQANAQWPDDALLLVYSSLKDLNFRSSLGAIDKVSYNTQSNRYEVFFKPNKQMLFVYASNFVERKIETFNPNPKDVFYYKVEEKQQAVVNTKPGTLKIVTEPSGADVFVNGMRMVDKTPFEGEPNPGSTRIKLQKAKYETIDTTVAVRSGEPTILNLQMKPTTLWVNISSTPSGAEVVLDDISHGITPVSFEMNLEDVTKRGEKQIQLTFVDHESINKNIELWPSDAPLELEYNLKKEKGNFTIISTIEGARVFIGGQYKGTTPLRGSMAVGQYYVEVKLEGFSAIEKSVEIQKNTTAQLTFNMRKEVGLPSYIGQVYGGGIVFELREDGHGLVVAAESIGNMDIHGAKKRCQSFNGNSFEDWYLPKIKDLKKLYEVRNTVNKSLEELDGEKLNPISFWGVITGATSARYFSFDSGRAKTSLQNAIHAVRPVRAF
jgi:hypothetical protein